MKYFHDQLRSIAEGPAHAPAFDGFDPLTRPERPLRSRPTESLGEIVVGLADVVKTFSPLAALVASSSFFSQYLPNFNPARQLLPALVAAGLRQVPELHLHDTPLSGGPYRNGIDGTGEGQDTNQDRDRRGFRIACKLMHRISNALHAGKVDTAMCAIERLLRVLDALTPETLRLLSPAAERCAANIETFSQHQNLPAAEQQMFCHYRFLLLARIENIAELSWK